MVRMSGWRAVFVSGLLVSALGVSLAQKDGGPPVVDEKAPPMAKDGVPPVVKIPAGSFVMGADAGVLPASVTNGFGVMSTRPEHGDFDEVPAHPVKISKPFLIGAHQVTPQEFQQFDPKYVVNDATPAYASGVSWNQAMAYCAWLTKKTGKPWRLPDRGGVGVCGARRWQGNLWREQRDAKGGCGKCFWR